MMGLGGCFGLTETSLELFYTQMRRERNSFWHSLFDGGGVPTDYIMVNRPDMISIPNREGVRLIAAINDYGLVDAIEFQPLIGS